MPIKIPNELPARTTLEAEGVMVMRDVTERRQLEQHTRQTLNALLAMAEIQFEGIYYRHDIGHRALRSKR